ncbi:Calx-beta domain-containing protein, partial [Leeuwenhoekiella sp.]|uniref:Ig-like domain-containing protein n=4 Tax=Leeuwenhoekiella TaxID=283735 RepID=UPI003242A519
MKYKTTPTYAKCIQRFVMFLFLNLLALGVNDTLYAQCDGYDEVSVTSGNYTFQSGERYAFKSATPTTITLSDVTFQNGTAVCVGPNVTLIIQNNINASGAVTLNVEGTLQFNQAINFNANLDMTIAEGGVFQTGNNGTVDFNIGGSGVNRILNSGEVKVGVLTFASGSSTNTIDNSGTFTISRNINISGDTEFRNQKDIYVGASFNCNATSVYVNCGVIETATGFNLGGGRIVNTGSFISNNGSIDFGSSTARIENYGIVQVEQVNFSGVDSSLYGGFYNEGSVILDNNFQASGNILGPTDNSKLGYFELANASTLNSGTIGPNLNFKRTTGPSNATSVFGSNAGSLTILSGVVYDCESGTCAAEKVSAGLPCPDLSGNFPAISLVKTGVFQDENGDGRTQVGETIDYTFEITNTGQKVLRDIVIEDGKLGLGTLSVPGTLDPGESTTATASYSVIAADLTTGSVYNEATVRGIDELDTEVSATDDFTVFFNNYCSGVDTDGDGIPDNCDDDDDNDGILDADEGNSSVAVLANPSQATVNDLNNTGTGLFELNVPGPASLASGGVRVSVLSYNNSNPNPNKWRIFQPVLDNGIININGGDVEFATEYLDVINGIPRTVEFDYGQSASELSTTTSKYRYVVGIAGLGGPSTRDELGVDIANVTLRVIGNVDVFDTDTYSTFAGNTPPERNTLGNTITSSEPRVFQGYTFFYIDDEDVSKFEIEFQNEDPHGIIFGVLEERFRDTDGDGIVDSKDVDSDNDGCPDAIEGAGSFNKTHLTADLNLANTPDGVDEFGVPTIAGSPQGNTQAVIDDSISACYVPTAIDDERQVSLNTSLNIDVLANDDFGGDGPSETQPLIITEQPANGSVVLNDNGTPSNLADDTIVYTPNQDYDGVDTFKYKIVDLDGDESEATVEITISDVIVVPPGERGCDCAPLYSSTNFKNPTLVSGSSGQVGAVYRFSNVFLDSPEPIDALVRIEAMRNGATLANIDVTGDGVDSNFQPQLNSTNNGDQNIEFDITFVESGGTYGDEVVISFFATPFDIDGDSVQTREYAELTLSDAYYQSGNTLINIERRPNSVRGTAVNASTAPGGDISTDPRYTFSTYYEGRSSLKYIIGKQNGNIDRFYSLAFSNANYTNPQSYIVTAPVICGNVSDEGGQPLSGVSIKIEGSDGSSTTLTTNSNGDYRYATAIPSALVDVVYTIIETDLDGYVSVDDAEGDPTDNVIVRTINLISSCQNNFVDDGRPEANDDSAEVSPLRPVQPIDIDVLANDNFGPDGPSTGAITTVSQPSLGSAEVNNAGTPNDPTDDYITYIPPSENLVTVTFKYQICDEDGDCDDALVTVTVSDDNPIAEDDNYTVSEDSRDNVLDILSNDYFGNDGAGSVSVLSGPANGVVVLNDNNTPGDVSDDFYEYTPNADFFGTDSFQYQICDGDTPVGDRDCDVATVTILVEADPTLSVDPVTVTEGDPLTFTFSINTVSAEDIVINVNTSDDTAIAGLDYTAAVNQLITIPAGQLSVDFVVNSLEDQIYEVAESFNISGAVQTNNTRNLNVATTGTITDNDGDAPTLSISDVSVVEGVDAVFAVSLNKPSFESITVALATAEGTALDPEDYTGYSGGSITFAPGETSKNITIATIDDAIYEVTENFTLNGEVTSGTTVNTTASGTGTITDNDGDAPTLSISDVSVVEGVDAVFAVSLDKPSFESITVALATAEGTALDPEDYTGYSGGSITFAPGETSKNITIATIDDAI